MLRGLRIGAQQLDGGGDFRLRHPNAERSFLDTLLRVDTAFDQREQHIVGFGFRQLRVDRLLAARQQ
jgi:hypothetical protein